MGSQAQVRGFDHAIAHFTQCTQMTIRSTVVERATYMRVYAGSSPTSADHRKELI